MKQEVSSFFWRRSGRERWAAVCTYLAFIFSTCRGRDVDSSCLVHSRITSVPSPTPQASRHVSTSTASWDSTGHGNTTRQYFRRRCELCTRMVRFSRSVQRCRASRNPDRSPQRAQLKGWTFHSRLAEWAARAATMPCGRARRQKPHQMMTAAGAKPHAASSAPLLAAVFRSFQDDGDCECGDEREVAFGGRKILPTDYWYEPRPKPLPLLISLTSPFCKVISG